MLRIEHLKKRYGSFEALKDLSLEIPGGALHGFVGPNGAGKTTTLRILATLMKPTAGDAYVDETSVVREGQKARRLVGYMPDFFGVYDNLKVREFYSACRHLEREGLKGYFVGNTMYDAFMQYKDSKKPADLTSVQPSMTHMALEP